MESGIWNMFSRGNWNSYFPGFGRSIWKHHTKLGNETVWFIFDYPVDFTIQRAKIVL